MMFSARKVILLFSLMLTVSIPAFSSTTSEIFGEIIGFSMGKGLKRVDLVLPVPHLTPANIETETKRQIREFIDEKINEVSPHDFFSIDRFSDIIPVSEDEQLIENWKVWYFGKYIVSELGGINARKELSITLESKKEFYENIAFMTTSAEVGLAAKEFYRKQLEAVGQLLLEE